MLTGDTFDFQQGDVVRSSAQIVDPGAAVGDVLTVQADGSIAAAAGGGSQPVSAYVKLLNDAAVGDGSPVPFDAVQTDADGYWDAMNFQFVVPAGKAGVFLVGGALAVYGSPDPMTKGRGLLDGSLSLYSQPPLTFGLAPDITATEFSGSATKLIYAADGDIQTLYCNTDQPAIAVAGAGCVLWLLRLGDLPAAP